MIWFLLTAQAWANEGGAAATAVNEAGHEIPWNSIFVQAFNLLFLLAILFFVLRKTVVAHFAHRAQEYKELVSRAETARVTAETGQREVKERLVKLEQSAAHVIEKARAEARELRTRMAQEAKSTALRLEQETERTVKAELEKAKTELRHELLEKAIQTARENLKKNLSTSEQQKLQREFSDKIQVVGG